MASRLLAISLVPTDVFARLLAQLRADHPHARVTALVGHTVGRAAHPLENADEVLDWRSRRAASLVGDLRRRGFDLAVVAHGGDQYATRAYWKAVALSLTSRARERVFREDETGVERGALRAVVGGAALGLVQTVEELYAGAAGLVLLLPLVVAVAATDLSEALVWGRCGRTGERPRER